jgi:hypothetical protein
MADRIELGIQASGDVAEAVDSYGDSIAGEVLARRMVRGALQGAEHREERRIEGVPVVVELRRAGP